MLPTRPTLSPRFGAGAALASGPAAVELEAAVLTVPAAAAATVAVVEVLALMGVLAWGVALAALVAVFCIRAAHHVHRRRQRDDRLPRR